MKRIILLLFIAVPVFIAGCRGPKTGETIRIDAPYRPGVYEVWTNAPAR